MPAVFRCQVSGFRQKKVSGVRKRFEVIANFVDVEGIGENIGANHSRRKAAQAAVPKIGFLGCSNFSVQVLLWSS
jgi:hypothetical protein